MQEFPYYYRSDFEKSQSRLFEFASLLSERTGRSFDDYASLHRFSVESRELFWDLVWEYCGVSADRRGVSLLRGGDMFSDVWYPDVMLSFRHEVLRDVGEKIAVTEYSEGEFLREISYGDLQLLVDRLAGLLVANGVVPGDRVAVVLPNGIDAIAIALATAQVGAVFCSCAPEFGTVALVDRLSQVCPKILFSVVGYRYGGKSHEIGEKIVEVACAVGSIGRVVLCDYGDFVCSGSDIDRHGNVGCLLKEALLKVVPLREKVLYPFNHPLYILFSSGTTGRPKCIVHGAGGTLLQHRKEHALQLNVNLYDTVMYLTTCGWMMWNWTVTMLAEGVTIVCNDGSPFYPTDDAVLKLLFREQVTCFGTSAKYISETLKRVDEFDASWFESLRVILSTGSPLLPEHYEGVSNRWLLSKPLVSLSGGTDIVSCFVIGNPYESIYSGEIQGAGLGMAVEVWNDAAMRVVGEKGELVCVSSFPSMPVYFWGDDVKRSKYYKSYFERFNGVWHHGDFAEETVRGGFVIYGRSDSVLNPGGVRIGTSEIYRVLESFPEIIESVCVGLEEGDDVIVALFVVLKPGLVLTNEMRESIKKSIRVKASPRHVPGFIAEVPAIPKTMSGKISEEAVRCALNSKVIPNLNALANPDSLSYFKSVVKK
ncbi:MAG: acetoacetate--CoA ligase [Methylacidiphilales bacterium]|nr:acetoacetate--CoA ligase [Candidatus Methylacidiphilales bacterium]